MKPTTARGGSGTVSVVIPAYNAGHTIQRAINSVLSQTVPPLEIIVVDDGSPDNQNAIIQAYGDRVTLIRQPNSRTASARNTGLVHASGDFIAFLDADDYWEPHKLERQLEVFAGHPEVGVVAGGYFVELPGRGRTEPGCQNRLWNDRVLHVQGEPAFRLATMMWTGTVIVRREVLGDERFVSGLEPAEDRDMWIRLALRAPVCLLSEPLSTAVLEPGSISRNDVNRDCSKMLDVIQRHKSTLGRLATLTWQSHTLYRWAALETAKWPAFRLLLRSLLYWPLPYVGLQGMRPLGRLKRLVVLLRMIVLQSKPVAGSGAA